ETQEGRLAIAFMARIMKEKGIDWIFSLSDHISSSSKNIEINFYGPIEPKDKEYFIEKINKYDFIKYHGIIQPKNVYTDISKHDVLVLPTRYEGEGFPGSIIDAYISGLPV